MNELSIGLILEVYLSSIIIAFAEIYIWNKLLKSDRKIFSVFNVAIALLISIIITFNYLLNNAYIKIVFITIIFSFVIKFLYRKSFLKCFCTAVFAQVIMSIGEVIFVLLTVNLNNMNIADFQQQYFSKIYTNLCIAMIDVIIVHFTQTKSFFRQISDILNDINKKKVVILMIALLFSINFLLGLTFYNLDSTVFVLITSLLLIIYTYITLQNLTQQEKTAEIRAEYNSLMDKSVEYEKMLGENMRDIHETKNDLIVLQGLVPKTAKEAQKQLKAMIKEYGEIENKERENEDIYRKTIGIPSGGLRGLFSNKLLVMEELKINYDLRIGKGINAKTLKNLDYQDRRDFGKVIGIYLDNAINATGKTNKKEINIEFFLEEGYFCVLISNTFSGTLDIEKMGTMGYTSKGGNHGYGLSLAKEILKKNKNIKSEMSVYLDILTKIVKIKM